MYQIYKSSNRLTADGTNVGNIAPSEDEVHKKQDELSINVNTAAPGPTQNRR